jgi:hypothetical protein
MKPSILALLIAAGAFGASTIYLAMQLREERAQSDQIVEQSRALQIRIAELERARAELELVQMTRDGSQISGSLAESGERGPAGKPGEGQPVLVEAPAQSGLGDLPGRGEPPQRSEAMRNMMRTQTRANFKRMNADIGRKLGLGQEEVNRLLDLMVEQQMEQREFGRQNRASDLTREQRAAAYQAHQQKSLAEVSALIGADKIELYKAYQETLPARQEVETLSRQLEGNDLTLSQDQRDRMVTALAEERQRVPMPQMSDSGTREEYSEATLAWQADYQERAATRARSILNSDQQETYAQYQQWSREMRSQSQTRRTPRQSRPAQDGPPPPP